MNRGGLKGADWRAALHQLALPHNWKVSVDLLTAENDQIVSFDPHRAGDRDVVVTDAAIQVTRAGRGLSMTVADPNKVLLVGQDANYTDRQFQVRAGFDIPALGLFPHWTDVFTGPIVSAPRSGDVIQFTAHDKSRYGKHGIRDIYVLKKGMPITTAIRRILGDLTGEQAPYMGNIPDLRPDLTADLTIHINQHPWSFVVDLADQVGRLIAYDGAGDIQMPRIEAVGDPLYTFSGALHQPGVIGDDVEVGTDWMALRNAVRRTGTPPKSGGPPPEPGLAFPDPSDPFSPQRQGRFDAPAYYWDDRALPNVHTHAELQTFAEFALKRDMLATRQVKLACLPMPCFDYGDYVAVETVGLMEQFHLTNFTIPLNLADSPTMSIGFNKRVSSNAFAGRGG